MNADKNLKMLRMDSYGIYVHMFGVIDVINKPSSIYA